MLNNIIIRLAVYYIACFLILSTLFFLFPQIPSITSHRSVNALSQGHPLSPRTKFPFHLEKLKKG